MNNAITCSEIETVIKNFPKNRSPGPDRFTEEVYQTFRKELMLILLKLFQKSCRGRSTSKFILRGHHHPDAKASLRQHKKRKLQANITNELRCKNSQQNFSKQNSATPQKTYNRDQVWFFSRDARILQYMQINQCDTMLTNWKKSHMTISIDAEKVFDKIQHPFMIKSLQKWT